MPITNLSFDDDSDEPLDVFSGQDLLTVHYDEADLAWEEVAQRSFIDHRRGLVIAQVAVLEDLVDEFILYLEDPEDGDTRQAELDRMTIGPRLNLLRKLLAKEQMLEQQVDVLLDEADKIVVRRNELAHGTTHLRYVGSPPPIRNRRRPENILMEWVLQSRRTRSTERITMSGLRRDLEDAIGLFMGMLSYAEQFVRVAPRPHSFHRGWYLTAPTP